MPLRTLAKCAMFDYLSGQLVTGGGAALPPHPVVTSAVGVGALFQAGLGALPKLLPLPKGCDPHELVAGAGAANAVG